MKKTSVAVIFLLFVQFASAQTWSEWFRQKKTKIKYLVTQIAALKAYGDVAWKGYTIAKKGLTAIGDSKEDDLSIHNDYFASLRSVNPVVKEYTKVAQIITLEAAILKIYQQQKKGLASSDQLTAEEIKYTTNVLTALLAGCADAVDELSLLTTDHSAGLKDDERIVRIDALYADMQEEYSFLKRFTDETSVLTTQRKRESSDIKILQTQLGVQ